MNDTHLFCWIDNAEARETGNPDAIVIGPVGKAVVARRPHTVHLISRLGDTITRQYQQILVDAYELDVKVHPVELSDWPTLSEIYREDDRLLTEFYQDHDAETVDLVFHLSTGTPEMAAIWIILGNTKYQAELITASVGDAVDSVSLPFEITAEYKRVEAQDPDQIRLVHERMEIPPEFDKIVHACDEMQELIFHAQKLAVQDVPILIQGDSGTGKELFAKAIHELSRRQDKPFIAVNCAAIPETLLEAEFFGHTKGAFTDAKQEKEGYFQQAHGGTLFLDEIGELALSGQVKLLRVLQENKVQKVGAGESEGVDVRIIAATNRNLLVEITEKRFRLDLFYRIALGDLRIPALSERPGCLDKLIDHFLGQINKDTGDGTEHRLPHTLSPAARKALHSHSWPGNVRELHNTITRAAIRAEISEKISKAHIDSALFPLPGNTETILDRPIGGGFDVRRVLDEVKRHYLARAREKTKTKTEAAQLLNLNNPTTLTHWLEKLNMDW